MDLNTLGFLKNEYVHYPAVLAELGKSSTILQPLFEAFTNAMEAIRQLKSDPANERITIKVYYDGDLFEENSVMRQIVIEDTGIGFNDDEFQRFLKYKDDRKGYHNRGSGRIQFIHSFQSVEFDSIFKVGTGFKRRTFNMSKSGRYLNEGAIAYLSKYEDVQASRSHTTLTLSGLNLQKDQLAFDMPLENYKEIIIQHYIHYLCANRESLPEIVFESWSGKELKETLTITKEDLPPVDSREEFQLHYFKNVNGLETRLEEVEIFHVEAFKIPKGKLQKNVLTLTSKGEIVDEREFRIALKNLSADDHVENNRFLFLVSSDYIDRRDGDLRGQLRIPRRQGETNLFDENSIYLEDIEEAANETIGKMYEAFEEKAKEKAMRVNELKEMFLLNDGYLEKLPISVNDTEERILEKVYVHESKLAAKADAELKKQIDHLSMLNPTAVDYDTKLSKIVNKLVKEIPHQNRAALTHYVARRRLVLELFQKVLDRHLVIQGEGERNIDEKILHNILFTQRSNKAEESDLWLLNEDFILYKGVSEQSLRNVTIGGVKIFKEELTSEEERFIKAGNEKRLDKRPDVLLFPAEEKCVILEFKTPENNVAEHINEIGYYASLILNLTKPEFPFKTFYGYLIGENIEPLDIKFNDSDFLDSAHFQYAFRPAKRIIGQFKNFEGSLYTEVLKYSTLVDRASARNKVLIDKLFPSGKEATLTESK